jgi:hypothetical protein
MDLTNTYTHEHKFTLPKVNNQHRDLTGLREAQGQEMMHEAHVADRINGITNLSGK